MRDSHCSYCGSAFLPDQPWPRQCAACDKITYVNPLPVAVGLVPVDGGLLLIRRTVEPHIGSLALPGGFMNVGETWQQGCVREIEEETGLRLPAEAVQLYDVLTALDGYVLIFGLLSPLTRADLPDFVPNDETSELVVVHEPTELAFPLHNQAATRYWKSQGKTVS